MWLVRSPLKSQELFGDGSRQVGMAAVIAALGKVLDGLRQTGRRYWPGRELPMAAS
jgi:hypothetical protein